MLSSKEKPVWICECGETNEMNDLYCTNCRKDIYGFNENEKNPLKVIEILQNKINILSSLLE
jgi:hypothetical protein